MSVLVVIEHAQGDISNASSCAVSAATKLADEIEVLATRSRKFHQQQKNAAKLTGVKTVKYLEHANVEKLIT